MENRHESLRGTVGRGPRTNLPSRDRSGPSGPARGRNVRVVFMTYEQKEINLTTVPVVYLVLVCSQSSAQNATRKPCDRNEEFRPCGTSCEPTCGNQLPEFCTEQCILDVCQCASGFVRHQNGSCVALIQCAVAGTRPTESPCGSNEEFHECGTACEPTCANPSPRICTLQCIVDVCQCARGYFRNDDEECVRLNECNNSTNTTVMSCGPNEHFVNCSTCERTCTNPNPICTMECKPPKCQCLPGYVRNSFGRCVNQSQCGVDDPCSRVRCRAGTYCKSIPCFGINCPRRAICVNACKGKRCPPGQHCELRNVTCIRAPCPPIPTCVNNTVSGRMPVDTVSLDVTEENDISLFD
ncbi:trypsin inhibitor like cysteine rich domain-containing protein [Ditylenchus destructor]|nr:trypsin inhibitor like cysteine rich domain-containing protein [Ditylenchus destructor]